MPTLERTPAEWANLAALEHSLLHRGMDLTGEVAWLAKLLHSRQASTKAGKVRIKDQVKVINGLRTRIAEIEAAISNA